MHGGGGRGRDDGRTASFLLSFFFVLTMLAVIPAAERLENKEQPGISNPLDTSFFLFVFLLLPSIFVF